MNAMGDYEGMKVESVVYPKPRRAGACNDPVIRPSSRFPYGQHGGDAIDFAAGAAELLDIILAKGIYGGERFGTPVASSPPYFNGSPPCRVSNPLIQDTHFGTEHFTPVSPTSPSSLIWSLSPSTANSSGRKAGGGGGDRGGCVRTMKFGHKTPTIRVEGFDCLGRDGRHCGISTLA